MASDKRSNPAQSSAAAAGAPSAATPEADWYEVEDTHLPKPTYWPAVMAVAITFVAWSILTSWMIGAVGVALFALSLGGWIGDLLHEH